MANERPAAANMPRSLNQSPTAATRARSTPRRAASRSSMSPLSHPRGSERTAHTGPPPMLK